MYEEVAHEIFLEIIIKFYIPTCDILTFFILTFFILTSRNFYFFFNRFFNSLLKSNYTYLFFVVVDLVVYCGI